ncbi:MAG: glycogen/starch synthase [Planctomycetota bacterium]
MKVAFVTPELQSLVRRTNLAEISEFLPRTLLELGTDVRVFLPKHQGVNPDLLDGCKRVGTVRVPDGEWEVELTLDAGMLGDLPVVLIGHDDIFGRRNPYGDEDGPYSDNWRRYALFARGVLEALQVLKFKADIIHCVDWTTGLIPVFHQLEYAGRSDHAAGASGVYFGIHNLAMQGAFEREILPRIGLPHELFHAVHGVELGGKVNFLKAGAEFATIIGTHSPSHAEQVQEMDRGDGLEDTFQRRKKELVGVLNGTDYRAWDPSTDPLLAKSFSSKNGDPTLGKRRCKAALQAALNLDSGPRTPLVTIIGRFDSDSGFDILAESLTPMLERNLELVLMGPGQPEIMERMRTVEQTFAGRCRVIEGYNVNMAHTLLGGADILILPSHYHSSNTLCAIAMRYGVSPIVYAHSGLEDTVIDVVTKPKQGTGVLFPTYNSSSLLEGVDQARAIYKKAAVWKELVKRCLLQDLSWQASARNYLKAYRRVTRRSKAKK